MFRFSTQNSVLSKTTGRDKCRFSADTSPHFIAASPLTSTLLKKLTEHSLTSAPLLTIFFNPECFYTQIQSQLLFLTRDSDSLILLSHLWRAMSKNVWLVFLAVLASGISGREISRESVGEAGSGTKISTTKDKASVEADSKRRETGIDGRTNFSSSPRLTTPRHEYVHVTCPRFGSRLYQEGSPGCTENTDCPRIKKCCKNRYGDKGALCCVIVCIRKPFHSLYGPRLS